MGGIVESQRFAGGPSPDGKDWIPNITPAGLREDDNAKDPWSAKEIASFLEDGQDPSGDYAGGAMVEVIRNTALLSAQDREAIALYIASLPPRQGPKPPPKKKD